jgi:thiamine biosynthesis lipoprotein
MLNNSRTFRMSRSRNAPWLTAAAILAASPAIARAEVYLTEAQALGIVLGQDSIPQKEVRVLDAETRRKLEHSSGLHFPEASYTFFVSSKPNQPPKYAIVLNEIGKSEPITFMVGMTADGKISEIVIMQFRENRGWEVKEKRFLNQFRGKNVRSSIRVDEDIINYTGATLSSKAIARGAKRALLLLELFYPAEERTKLRAARDWAKPSPLSPLIVASSSTPVSLYRQARFAMGTLCEIRVWTDSPERADRAFASGFAELERIEERFSLYRSTSELSHVNREAGQSAVVVSREFFQLTRFAMQAWKSTGGLCDITVGPLMELWGLGVNPPRIPDLREIASVQRLIGADRLFLNGKQKTLRFRFPGVQLDFGGLAKGYAAQQVARVLETERVASGLVNLGQSSLTATRLTAGLESGDNEPSRPFPSRWLVAIRNPDSGSNECPVLLTLSPGQSLATSGTYEREFTVEGKKVSHLFHPQTARSLTGRRSATVLTRSALRSETLAKAWLLGGPNRRINWQEYVLLDVDEENVLHLEHKIDRFGRPSRSLPSASV